MNTKQISVIIISLLAISCIYIFGNTTFPKKSIEKQQQTIVSVNSILEEIKPSLDKVKKEHLTHLLEDLKTAQTDTVKKNAFGSLAVFFENDIENEELAAYYFAEKVKLENSQKNLTFAANLILKNCINDDGNVAKRGFRANVAKTLYEKALLQNPENDSLNIGLGGCYMFGAGGNNPMEGISKVLAVLKKDSTNPFAHKMLGFGNLQNGQTDKAVERFIKSYNNNKEDVGLVPYIALLSKRLGKMEMSKEWYDKAKLIFQSEPKMLEAFKAEYDSIK